MGAVLCRAYVRADEPLFAHKKETHMNNGWKVLALVTLGILAGTYGQHLLMGQAQAEGAAPTVKYKVVGGSMSAGGYEEDLNKFTSQGWRYVGAIPRGEIPSDLIFAKP